MVGMGFEDGDTGREMERGKGDQREVAAWAEAWRQEIAEASRGLAQFACCHSLKLRVRSRE